MYDKNMLRDGLSIISLCKEETNDIWHAHFGAAAIASYFFIKDNQLSLKAANKISTQAKMMLNIHALGYTTNRLSEVDFQKAEEMILKSLEKTITELHWVGHNVIYAALSLLAIYELGNWGTAKDIKGIIELLSSFEKTIPGRSWIGFSTSEVKVLQINNEDCIPSIENPKDLSEFILNELAEFKIIYRAESHHDLIGHMLTFSHALNILYDFGYLSFFKRGLLPLLKLVKVLRKSKNLRQNHLINVMSPVDRLPLIKAKPTVFLPSEEAFWLKDHRSSNWDFGHQFKFTFSYFDRLKRAPKLKEATIDNFCCIINS
ncbi:hypothetical protein FZC66_08850 [Priestia megaterium]|nr:hypothetical protein FZC66_08850 [Priestia megaterium]